MLILDKMEVLGIYGGVEMEEIELRELIEILIDGRKTIAIITVISILIAAIFSFVIIKPTYEAKMLLMTSNMGGE